MRVPAPDSSAVVHSSTSDAVHRHGSSSAYSANLRTVRSRQITVPTANRRLRCWERQPASIASNTAGPGCSNAAPDTNTSRAEPAGSTS